MRISAMSKNIREAVTLLELLVVLAIIAILIGLLLPAIQAIRGRAMEVSNCNNLKQINLATIHFAEMHQGTFPGERAFLSFNYKAKEPFVLILPYLEQESLYRAFTDNPLALLNAPKKGVDMFFNPLDPTRSRAGTSSFGGGVNVRASYADNYCVFRELPTIHLPDGNSNTILYAEHYSICGEVEFLFPEFGRTSFANHLDQQANPRMNPLPLPFQYRPSMSECDPKFPNTANRSGMHCGMADGSTRLFSPSVASAVYWAHVTPNGGEVVTLD
jgi:prepilin-type N-terminal cleavage/methylation domain-containing protein